MPKSMPIGKLIDNMIALGIIKNRRAFYRQFISYDFPHPEDTFEFISKILKRAIEKGIHRDRIKASPLYGFLRDARSLIDAKLIDEWNVLAHNNTFTKDCLTRIAAYSERIQRKVFNENHKTNDKLEDVVTWSDYKNEFLSCLMDLGETPFDTTPCKTCHNNTACSQNRFPDLKDGDARCQDAVCFKQKWNEAVDALLMKYRKAGLEVIQVPAKYKIPEHEKTASVQSESHPQPYLYEEEGLRHIVFGKRQRHK